MNRIVVDASVIAKLFFQEPLSDIAVSAVREASDLLAPELIWAELASVAWKRVTRGRITEEQACHVLDEALRMPIHTHPLGGLAAAALKLAVTTKRSVYDCLYLALAIDQQCRFLTADERLVNALADSRFARHICLLSERH